MFSLIWLVLELVTAWKVFEKYGEPGWKGLVPFYSDIVEFDKVWTKGMGILYIVAAILSVVDINKAGGVLGTIAIIGSIAVFVINIMFANKKAKAFGGAMGLTLVLIFLPFIGNLYIGFSKDVEYKGNLS